MKPRGKEGQGDLEYFRGEREVKDSWQGCSMGADGEEMVTRLGFFIYKMRVIILLP